MNRFSDDKRAAILREASTRATHKDNDIRQDGECHDEPPEPEPERRLTLYEAARDTPNNAVQRWAIEGEIIEARRKVAHAEMLREQKQDVEARHRAWAPAVSAGASREVRDYMQDMLPIIGDVINERIAESTEALRAEMKAPAARELIDLPNPIASRRMQ